MGLAKTLLRFSGPFGIESLASQQNLFGVNFLNPNYALTEALSCNYMIITLSNKRSVECIEI